MSRISTLTSGCIERILSETDVEKPVLQILGSKILVSGSTHRLRLLVSDGKHYYSLALMSSELNALHTIGELEENTIVRLDRYTVPTVSKSGKEDKRVLMVLELTILNPGSQVGRKIGSPVEYASDSSPQNTIANKPNATAPTTNDPIYANCKPVSSLSIASNTSSSILSSGCNMYTQSISSLCPYQTKWSIKARVTGKSAMRPWSNAQGNGRLFNMELMDESGEIKATAYLEKFFDIEFNKIYYFSKCRLKPANKQYQTVVNDYEMELTNETVVQLCDDNTSVPEIKYNFVEIKNIVNEDPKASIDVIGVCKETTEIQKFTGRTNNREFTKREVVLVDHSNASVSLTLWGDDALNFDGSENPVVLVKGARVSEFGGGKSLSVGVGSTLKINPEIEKGHQLKGWYEKVGRNTAVSDISTRNRIGTEWMTLLDAKWKNLGGDDKPHYFQVKAVIHIVRTANALYKACPLANCNKKVLDEDNGQYRCDKCNTTFHNFKNQIRLDMSIADWTSNCWVTAFNDVAEQLLGKTADEIDQEMKESGQQALQPVNFKSYIFKLRAKKGTYRDIYQKRMTIVSAIPVNYKEYNKYLIKELEEMLSIKNAI